MAEKFRDKIAELLNIDRENVDVFSVQLRRKHPPVTDVRFSAHGGTPYYKPVRLNGMVLMHREAIERAVGINITMVSKVFLLKLPIYRIKLNWNDKITFRLKLI